MRRKHIAQDRWTAQERQAYADGVTKPRAKTIQSKKKVASKEACRKWRWN